MEIGVEMALSVLCERGLSAELQEQVIEDTLGGAPGAKRAWTESGMTSDITAAVSSIKVPTVVIVGNADRVETEDTLRKELGTRIPSARFVVLQDVGHLSPLEAPREVAAAISDTVGML